MIWDVSSYLIVDYDAVIPSQPEYTERYIRLLEQKWEHRKQQLDEAKIRRYARAKG